MDCLRFEANKHQQTRQEPVIYWNAARGLEVGLVCSRRSVKPQSDGTFEKLFKQQIITQTLKWKVPNRGAARSAPVLAYVSKHWAKFVLLFWKNNVRLLHPLFIDMEISIWSIDL